jgi:superfamily II DNA or RNA helicase
VAVEAFLEWMQYKFDENKFMIWIAQSEELCEQCISCIEELWKDTEFILPLKVYRYFSKYNFPEDEELSGGVIVAGISKLYYNINDERILYILENAGAMIIDEAHRATTAMYDELLKNAKDATAGNLFPICGLSATPGRNTVIDDSEVNKLVDMFQMNLITPKFSGEERYQENPIAFFKEQQYLSKVNHIVINSGLEYKMTEDEIKELEEKNEYAQSFLKLLAKDTKRNLFIIKRLLKIKKGQPTLIYTCTVEHAMFLSAIMNTLERKSSSISSDTNKTERRIIINEFKNSKIDFLFNYGVLTTGFDAPKTRNIVICRPINSNILYEQIIGRGVRGIKFGGTEECDVIDFSDNIHNFGEQKAFMRFKEYWDKEHEEA